MNDRSEDMKRISQNLGRFVDFREIAEICTFYLNTLHTIYKRQKGKVRVLSLVCLTESATLILKGNATGKGSELDKNIRPMRSKKEVEMNSWTSPLNQAV